MSASLSRRTFMCVAASVAAASVAPKVLTAAIVPAPATPLMAFAVGSPGEDDWNVVYEASAEAAKIAWISNYLGIDRCEGVDEMEAVGHDAWLAAGHVDATPDSPCECDWCQCFHNIDTKRMPTWDGKKVVAGDAEWFERGFGAACIRCGYETSRDEGGQIVAGKVVCEECMTLDDWRLADPEYATELERLLR